MDDLVVVSDLHLGRGFNARTRRYHPLEAFFYDEEFCSFCAFLVARAAERGRPLRLVLNGDTFDFLRVPPSKSAERYAPPLTPARAAQLAAEMLAGHPRFVDGLATVLRAGHSVVILPGNHDLEIHWAPVQAAVRAAVEAALAAAAASSEAGAAVADALARLRIEPWFYHEAGRVWIEHGSQYDPENASRWPLRGALADDASFAPEDEPDLPLGSFFQRYLYNAFGSITFIVPTTRANGRYAKWLLLNQPRVLVRVVRSHVPFALQVLRRLSRGTNKLHDRYAAAHEKQLAELAASSGLGDRLVQIDALKRHGGDALLATQVMLRQTGKLLALAGGVALALGIFWITLSQAVATLGVGFGLKALLTLALDLFIFVGTTAAIAYRLLRLPAQVQPRPLRQAAARIHALTGVPLTLFGHSHEEVVFAVDDARARADEAAAPSAWYLNSGTWIAVFTHDVLLPRERVQFTFVDVVGTDAKLMQWSAERACARPVILLDESRTDPPPT